MKPQTTPKDFFLHLGAIVALYTSAISFINLLFEVINYAFPDQLQYYVDPYSTSLRSAVAVVLIFFPLYILLSWTIGKVLAKEPEKANLPVRRWLAYITLFVAGLTIAIDLVVLVNNFLGGEITSRFIYKVIVVLAVAGLIFWYYLRDLKRKADGTRPSGKNFAIGVSVLVVLALVWSFAVMGSPARARDLRFDEQRVNDLSNIQSQIVYQYQRTGSLPANLAALTDNISGFSASSDPQSGKAYEYRTTGKLAFTLCADFALEDSGANSPYRTPVAYPAKGTALSENWAHGAGHVCFDRTIDLNLYPLLKN